MEGEIRFIFPSGLVRVRCSIERPPLPADVRATPTMLQIRPSPLGRASATLTFRNRGELPGTVSLCATPPDGLRFEPAEFDLEAGAEASVLVVWQPAMSQAEHLLDWLQSRRRSGSDRHLATGPAEYLLEWRLDGDRGGYIPLELATMGGVARAVACRLWRAAAEHGLGTREPRPGERSGMGDEG
jgi:hypothetical protein